MEAQAKRNNEHSHDQKEAKHGEENILKHEDEDTEGGKLLEVGEEVYPGHRQ